MTVQQQVLEVFADLTRYPAEILDPDADLESDLGIDSVKRAEILAVLSERFSLPVDMELPAQSVGSITNIARFIEGASNGTVPVVRTEPVKRIAPQPRALPTPPPSASARPVIPAPQRVQPESPAVVSPAPVAGTTAASRRDVLLTMNEVIQEALARLDGVPVAAPAQPSGPTAVAPQPSARPAVPQDGLAWHAQGAPTASQTAASSPWLGTADRPFTGRLALITGSGHGLGRAIAARLAGLGATVVVNSFHSRDRGEQTAQELRDAGLDAHHVWGSVAKPEHLDRLFDEIEERWGYLDFFVSNASNGIIAPLEHVTAEHWDKALSTNVVALHQGTLRAAKLMERRGGGRVLCISSPGAQRHIDQFGCMGTAKAAMESLVRYLAVELGPKNVQINALSAGPLYGELLSRYPNGESLIPYWESRTISGELGTEAQITEPAIFLLSDAAHGITGTTLLVDNGGSLRI
jgi:NAD(P)-dependent dehydrogenase (short-subunit alcohol dehydrogenase family)/acyl carrier protein